MSRMDINEFVDTMLEQQSQFENIQSSITRCENEVDQVISDLENTERRLVDSSRAKMGDNRDSDITNIFDVSSESLVHTITEVNQKIREAVKGMEFIQDFEKHFTVAVFGKVKAGKSYIGNFVMGNGIKKLGLPSSYDKLPPITVHVYDRGKVSTQDKLEEQPDDGDFATGMKETTSTIQWFDLGGLSWFDTPGIGSVTWENEMLAKEYVKMGYYIGIGGVVTFKNAKKLKQVVQEIPLESIVLETDCPYLAPVPYRGKRNSSLYLPYVAEEIAALKGAAAEDVVLQTEENARKLYGL